MTQFDRMKGVRSSGLLTGFWFLLLVTWGFVFKEKVVFLNISSVVRMYCFADTFVKVVLIFSRIMTCKVYLGVDFTKI